MTSRCYKSRWLASGAGVVEAGLCWIPCAKNRVKLVKPGYSNGCVERINYGGD